jgi:CRISPR/Cas system-associated exonuclease Cas4 (RecB family)
MPPLTLAPAVTLFRDAFNAELDDLLSGGNVTRADFRAAGRRATKANPNPAGEDESWWRREGPKMTQAWIDWRKASKWRIWTTPDQQPAIELALITEVAAMPLKMVIDRVMVIPAASNALCIVDLKSGSRTPESDLQLGVYRLGILRTFGCQIDFGAYWMARTGRLGDIVNLSRYTEPVLEKWFSAYRRAVENEIFIPHLTTLCRACGLNRYCLAFGGSQAHMDPDSSDHKEEQAICALTDGPH